ncbi:hypothetical protein MACJ_001949 [Theileria orientalis]|uniref:Uncharacterized protein n=1 Tax=Theileria orientalis TaxID=68886 RepID=A0A976M580_THEOR|nr:hypothetical protein MACJ_001949 [Theileria orientalis]
MVNEEKENFLYNSPSDLSNQLKSSQIQQDNYNVNLDNSEEIELPISNNFNILSPEEGSITRYANIFDETDNYDSYHDDLDRKHFDSYNHTYVYRSNRLSPYSDVNKFTDYYNHDTHTQKSMTFSDRVVKERQRMIRMNISSNRNFRPREMNKHNLRPHVAEIAFSLINEEDIDLENKIFEKHKRISNILSDQKEVIRDIKLNTNRTDVTNEKLLKVQQENAKLLSDNLQNCQTIKNLKIDIENAQSDLIVERKQNEQLLKDKVELQNKIGILSKENMSLLNSQEMMQNMHNNEVEDLNSKKAELSTRISELQNDLDFFRDSLQESHKMNEMLRSEMSSLIDVYKNDKESLQKLKVENKRLMENNSIYKSQNYSLIEINDRLRKRTLFCNHTGDFSTTNSSTITNLSSGINLQSTPTACSPNGSHSTYASNSLNNIDGTDQKYLNSNGHNPVYDGNSLEHSLGVSNFPTAFHELRSVANTNDNSYSINVSPNSNTRDSNSTSMVSNSCNLDLVFNSMDDNNANTNTNSPFSVIGSSYSSPYNNSSDNKDIDVNESYGIVNLINNDKISNPTTKWVTDRVSRKSSMDALESLREKIRSISLDSNVENVNINTTLNCFQSNVTINLIQNKLQLISQRLNETTV